MCQFLTPFFGKFGSGTNSHCYDDRWDGDPQRYTDYDGSELALVFVAWLLEIERRDPLTNNLKDPAQMQRGLSGLGVFGEFNDIERKEASHEGKWKLIHVIRLII